MDSQEKFYDIIHKHYFDIVENNVPADILKELCRRLADHFFEQYKRFGQEHPKSIKRYSTFQVKDLNHPETFELIIKYFKEKFGTNYKNYSLLLLDMSEVQLLEFEKNREDFYNMF